MNGRYITAEDVGTTEEDMNLIYQETDYVTGISASYGSSGNPSPATAWGVYRGIKAAAKEAFGTDLLEGKTIAVQGVGNVAMHLCKYLYEEGAHLIVTDIHKDSVKQAVDRFGATQLIRQTSRVWNVISMHHVHWAARLMTIRSKRSRQRL